MGERLAATLLLMVATLASYTQGVSTEWADSLLRTLSKTTPDAERMHVYFMAAQGNIFKGGAEEADLDSAEDYIRKASELNEKVRSADASAFTILLESFVARERQQFEEGKELAEKAVGLLQNAKNRYYTGVGYFGLSEYYRYGSAAERPEKIRLVELAARAFHEAGYIEQEAYSLKFVADLYALNDDRAKALERLDQSLELYKSIKYPALHAVYILYSNINYTAGNYKQSLTYGLTALKSAVAAGDNSMSLCQINNHIGNILARLKDHGKAIEYYLDALKVAQGHDDNDAVLQVMTNIVESYIELKKPEEALAFVRNMPKNFVTPKLDESHIYLPLAYLMIYKELKDYSTVQLYSSQIHRLIKQHKPTDKMLHKFYAELIETYLQSMQYSAAGLYIGVLDSLSKKIGDPHRIRDDYYLKFRLDTAWGHYKSAAENLLSFQRLNDSLFNETTSSQIKQLEVEYEMEKSRTEIALLNQKNLVQANRLDRAQLLKNVTFGGIGLLVIIMALLYWQYRHKQQSNKVILQKNEQLQHLLTEKEWLVKEIHHRVKNNFHTVSSLLEIQSSYLKHKEALSAIKESQHRIHAMSIIHQKLYQSETLSIIHMPEYIYELVEYLRESYSIRGNIAFALQIEKIDLNHASAITLGLILNEAITNAIKYAFPKSEDGQISISLSHISDSQLLLSIADNGRGLPSDFETRIGSSMGMELLQGLTDDLGGSLSIETNGGTHIKVIFSSRPIVESNVSFS